MGRKESSSSDAEAALCRRLASWDPGAQAISSHWQEGLMAQMFHETWTEGQGYSWLLGVPVQQTPSLGSLPGLQ